MVTYYVNLKLIFFRVQSAYILWLLINKLKHGLGEPYQKIYDQFYFEAFGIKSRKPRSELCLGYTVNALGFAIAKIFVDEAYDTTAKTTVSNFFKKPFTPLISSFLFKSSSFLKVYNFIMSNLRSKFWMTRF